MKKTSVPIVVISSHDTAKNAYEATLKGALEFYSKETFSSSLRPEKQREIYETLKRISGIKATRSTTWDEGDSPLPTPHSPESEPVKREIHAVVIASSTGGPKALSRFFSLLPGDFPVPIVIVQHNSSGFDESFAQWLDTFTALNVKIAEEGEAPRRHSRRAITSTCCTLGA